MFEPHVVGKNIPMRTDAQGEMQTRAIERLLALKSSQQSYAKVFVCIYYDAMSVNCLLLITLDEHASLQRILRFL